MISEVLEQSLYSMVVELTLSALKGRRFLVHRLAVRQQACALTGAAVAHGGNPQDRAALPTAQEGKFPQA